MKLTDTLSSHFRILPVQASALKRLGISTIEDLLYYFPLRYGDTAEVRSIESLAKGETAVIFGNISGLKTGKGFKSRIPMSEATVTDETGKIKIVWFHQAYLAKILSDNAPVRVEGKVSQKKSGELYFSNPKVENVGKVPIAVGNSLFGKGDEVHALYPVYPETRGLTSNWIYHKLQTVFLSKIIKCFRFRT